MDQAKYDGGLQYLPCGYDVSEPSYEDQEITRINSRMYRQLTFTPELDPRFETMRCLRTSQPDYNVMLQYWSPHTAGATLLRMSMFQPWFRKDARLAHTHMVWENRAFTDKAHAPVYVLMLRNPFNWIASVHRRSTMWPQITKNTNLYFSSVWLQYLDVFTRMLQNPELKGRVIGTTLEQVLGAKAQISERLANLVGLQTDLLQGYEPSMVAPELVDKNTISSTPFLLDGWRHWTKMTAV